MQRKRKVGTGYTAVNSEVVCVLTRFQLRSSWALVRCYLRFRRVKQASRAVPGLIESKFLISNPCTFFNLSIWENESAIARFNTNVSAHIDVANSCFSDLARTSSGSELWSAQFRLDAVSKNLRWDGLGKVTYKTA